MNPLALTSDTEHPQTYAAPLVGLNSIHNILIYVVLPHPFAPKRHKHSSYPTTYETPLTALCPVDSYVFYKFKRRTSAGRPFDATSPSIASSFSLIRSGSLEVSLVYASK